MVDEPTYDSSTKTTAAIAAAPTCCSSGASQSAGWGSKDEERLAKLYKQPRPFIENVEVIFGFGASERRKKNLSTVEIGSSRSVLRTQNRKKQMEAVNRLAETKLAQQNKISPIRKNSPTKVAFGSSETRSRRSDAFALFGARSLSGLESANRLAEKKLTQQTKTHTTGTQDRAECVTAGRQKSPTKVAFGSSETRSRSSDAFALFGTRHLSGLEKANHLTALKVTQKRTKSPPKVPNGIFSAVSGAHHQAATKMPIHDQSNQDAGMAQMTSPYPYHQPHAAAAASTSGDPDQPS
jgi:hypothetical protein